MIVISLGWGVQSFGLAAMSALGVLPKVDVAIHADTTHERSETYAFAKRWTPWLEERGIKVMTLHGTRTDLLNLMPSGPSIPARTTYSEDVWGVGGDWIENESGDEVFVPDGSKVLMHRAGEESGFLRRQCTYEWKILPIRNWVHRHDKSVSDMWMGITLDEVTRMRVSDKAYIRNVYPFVELLIRPWTRSMVVKWLLDNGLEVPVKSACVFCPYHDRRTWREIKLSGNGDWQKAVEVDEAIRKKRPGYVCYLTRQLKPLVDCDFSSPEDHGQLALWPDEECQGMCFL